jgi:hypothetical protein
MAKPFCDLVLYSYRFVEISVIPKHKEEATDDIREKGERGQKNGRSIQTRNK